MPETTTRRCFTLGARYDPTRTIALGCSVSHEHRSADPRSSYDYRVNSASCYGADPLHPEHEPGAHDSTTVLLTGATGYIASHTWLALQDAGLRRGRRRRLLEQLARGAAAAADAGGRDARRSCRPTCCDAAALDACSRRDAIDAVVHFAALQGGRRDRPRSRSPTTPTTSAACSTLCRGDAAPRLPGAWSSAPAPPSTASPSGCRSARTRRCRRPTPTARPS